MKVGYPLLVCAVCCYTPFVMAADISKKQSEAFIENFYRAIEQRDEKKLFAMLTPEAQIKLRLDKMQQTFSLSRSDFMQQLKATWRFSQHQRFNLKQFILTENAGQQAKVSYELIDQKRLLNEELTYHQQVQVTLQQHDEQLQITHLMIQSNM
ncbi:hypothetical protein [Agitococcus lubricus]|uniref:DUF3887 domain-containing protein n=1 Tax=Agitococcus lubricus TaxID=1077255 RepID=A0A2T5J0V0_9GAMM|nr:hypothetical protein [Agitococcus lubricus]PTQ90015.1 hypothetical protein C8N29_10453 [Agitococcus lubricus]